MNARDYFVNVQDQHTKELAIREFDEIKDLVDIFESEVIDEFQTEEGISEGFKMLSVDKDF